MKKERQSVASKVAFLRLAEELNNVAMACRITGHSRDTYYRLKKLYDAGGEPALRNQSRSRTLKKNQVSEEIQQRILEVALQEPELGQRSVSTKLTAEGLKVSENGVRSVWLRYDIETRKKRLEALRAKSEQGELRITDKHMAAFQMIAKRYMDDSGELITAYPGNLLVQDTFEIDQFPHLSPLYLHVVVDSYTRYVFARYDNVKRPQSSRDFLVDLVIPVARDKGMKLHSILTDRGAEFYRPKEGNAYQQTLKDLGFQHILVKAYNSSKLDGICRQFEKLVETDFFPSVARKNQYAKIDDLQPELDRWVAHYNSDIPQLGRYCYGKSPAETLQSSVHLVPEIETVAG